VRNITLWIQRHKYAWFFVGFSSYSVLQVAIFHYQYFIAFHKLTPNEQSISSAKGWICKIIKMPKVPMSQMFSRLGFKLNWKKSSTHGFETMYRPCECIQLNFVLDIIAKHLDKLCHIMYKLLVAQYVINHFILAHILLGTSSVRVYRYCASLDC
jgi:hypothetical protein